MKKRLTAMLLVVCMLFTFMPTAFAAGRELKCDIEEHTHTSAPGAITADMVAGLDDSAIVETQEGTIIKTTHGNATFTSGCWQATVEIYSDAGEKIAFQAAKAIGKAYEYLKGKLESPTWTRSCDKQEHMHTDACYETTEPTEPTDPQAELKSNVLRMAGETYQFNVYYRYDGELPENETKVAGEGDVAAFGPNGNDTPLVTITVKLKELFDDPTFNSLAKIQIKDGYKDGAESKYFYIYSAAYSENSAPDDDGIEDFWNLIQNHMVDADKENLEKKSGGKFVGYVLKEENYSPGHMDGVLKVLPPVYSAEMYDPDGTLLKAEFADGEDVNGETTPQNAGVSWASVEKAFEDYLKGQYNTTGVTFVEDGKTGSFECNGYQYSFGITSSTNSEKNGDWIKNYQSKTQNGNPVAYLALFKIENIRPVTGKLTIAKTLSGLDADKLSEDFQITATLKDAENAEQHTFDKSDIENGKTFENVVPGKYTIAETGAEVNRYTLSPTGLGDVEVEAGKETIVTITNTYTRSDYDYKFLNGEKEVASGTKNKDEAIGEAPADPAVENGQRFDGWFLLNAQNEYTDEKFDSEKAYNTDVTFKARFTDVVAVEKDLTTEKETYNVGDEVEFKITVTVQEDTAEPLTLTEIPGTGLINGKLTCEDATLGIVSLGGLRTAKVEIDGSTATVTPIMAQIPLMGTVGGFEKGDTITFTYTATLGMPGSDANIFGGNQTCNTVQAALNGATAETTTDPIEQVNHAVVTADVTKTVKAINGETYTEDMTAAKGDTVTYEVTVTNTGSVPIFGVPALDHPGDHLTDGKFIAPESTLDLTNIDISDITSLIRGKSTVNIPLGEHVNIVLTADWTEIDPANLLAIVRDIRDNETLDDWKDTIDSLITKPNTSASSIQEAVKNIEEYISTLLKKYEFLDMTIYIDGSSTDAAVIGRLDPGETVTLTYEATVEACDENGEIINTAIVGIKKATAEIDAARVTITYTDGVADEDVFADQAYTVLQGSDTPAFEGTPTRDGYVFTGWDPEVRETADQNQIYTAQWKVAEVPVLFYLEGTGTPSYEVPAPVPSIPTLTVAEDYVYLNAMYTTVKDGEGATGHEDVTAWLNENLYVFSGTYTLADLIDAANAQGAELDAADFAGWQYASVRWEGNEGWHVHLRLTKPATPLNPVYAAYDTEYYLQQPDGSYALQAQDTVRSFAEVGTTVTAEQKTYSGYVFNASKSTASGVVVSPTVEDEEVKILTLQLYYDIKPQTEKYTVTFEGGDHGKIKGQSEYTYEKGEKIDTVPDVERDSSKYRFDGWYCKELKKYYDDDDEIRDIHVYQDLTFVAQWDRKSSSHSSSTKKDDDKDVSLNTEEHFQYIFGMPDGTVRPLNSITRAEVASIFYRLLDDRTRDRYFTTENDFPDVNDTMWYNKAVSTLVNAGIITGCTDGQFHGGRNITRAELATIIAKFDDGRYSGRDQFDDIASHWARDYINAAAENGWVVGDGTGMFRPYDDITRAEVMTMVNAVLNRSVDEDGLCRGYKQWPDNIPGAWYYYQVIEATNYHEYEWTKSGEEDWTDILPDKIWDEAGR